VPVIPYTRPGSSEVKPLVAARAGAHAALLLANHGPVVAGSSLEAAVHAIEELEETAKLLVLARGLPVRRLSDDQVADLHAHFPRR
jgi:3-dehydro-4-phosphotetronate decarboxylase